ncbi:ATP-dependent RNA helicase HrpA [Methyloprofundus sedimenti]|uniref:ATP-dependent RNA helicase HrpA n=1 Tax=Methyloprofundus sedimenti TaxID=1420851 RepID=A0A1V8M9C9_9GAMM|nr:ATP-dependent RNA helicase HrpA [Methyloprofundus sedimenti]OQK18102.1 ATP-dependent RNA helicase HrpA [Methyloprofundus sedimenti]
MPSQQLIKQISKNLSKTLNKDRQPIKRQLDRLRNELRKGQQVEEKLRQLELKLKQSIQKRHTRLASFPVLDFPDLPISAKKDEIAELIKNNQVMILCGETGSGKTTQLPKICLSIGRGAAGLIGHTQPRRIAARTVADRIAEELKQPLGQAVGYKVRFHDQTRETSLIKLMTDGILLAESQNDPYLSEYDTIIIDEAHERSLNIDFLLGYMRWLLPRRPDLKLIITSATIDPERFSEHFFNAPIINVSGRTFPVEMRYRPIEQDEEEDETTSDVQQAILDAVDELQHDISGDILIFLSGERDIRETHESLSKHNQGRFEILPLYSKLSVSEQERVFKTRAGKRRIVLSTNVAETSLTVPGIRSVIDVGHARISRYSHRSKIQRLPIEKVSQASANQRAGRCGRVAEGICIRLYSHDDYLSRPEFTEPEIKRTSLSAVILQMASLKLGDIRDFPFVEPPEDKMIRDGLNTLQEVNALDNSGKLTPIGQKLAKLPVDPKLARMLIAADAMSCLSEVAIIVSGLSIQDPREKPADKMQQADSKHAEFIAEGSDFLSFINIWNTFEERKKHLSNNQLRKWCKQNFLSYVRLKEWQDVHTQILQVIRGELKLKLNSTEASYEAVHQALLPGLLSNIGFKHEQNEYLGARNLKFFIFPGSGQYKLRPKWIMAAEQVETSKVYGRCVARIEPQWIERSAQHLIKKNHFDPHWEKKAARGAIFERTLLFGITLQSRRKIPYEHVDAKAARQMFIRQALVEHDYQTNAPFFKANEKLLEEVGYIQHKGRRVDLIEDEEWLYDFYEQKLPETVVNGITFDQWRKTVEREHPRLLFLTKENLTRHDEGHISSWEYPDEKQIGRLTLPLQYRFEIGHAEDGVTAVIPVHQLNQLTEQAFEWLVPGLLKEKLIALIKGLPKQLRKHFVPVPSMVDCCLEVEPDGKGSLYEWLSMRLRKLTGESIPLTAWNTELITDHLRMNFRVIDEQGIQLDNSRDLKALQRKYNETAGDSFNQLAEDELNYTGCIKWVFGELPEVYQFEQNGQNFIGYPAIIDEGDAVGVRILDTQEKADLHNEAGLSRLFQLHLKKDTKYILKNLPFSPESELAYNRLSMHGDLTRDIRSSGYKEDMLGLVIRSVFVSGRMLRTEEQFEQCLKDNKPELINTANKIGEHVVKALTLYTQIKILVDRLPQDDKSVIDVQQQLARLFYQGFLTTTSNEHLKHYPRYLKAIETRLQSMLQQPDKDQQKMQEMAKFQQWFWQSIAKRQKDEIVNPEREVFRWMLEEFRVSLFAQQLKTPIPVSAKRLEKAWNSL